jgi:diphthine synthase
MSFYLIGLGLEKDSISVNALKILENCDKIYLENYTVNFPYSKEELEKSIDKKILLRDREKTENESILEESKNSNIALLVYGDALSATTHSQLISECKKQKINYQVFHNASIITAVAITGLQPYKFGKTASMPNWKEHTNKPTSFTKYIQENQSIKSHTLILTDIGLELNSAIKQLKESCEKEKIELPEKIIALSNIGTIHQKIIYETIENLKKEKIEMPFCIIIPSKLHFLEEEFLENIN